MDLTRIKELIDAKSELVTESGCRLWRGSIQSGGYGDFQLDKEKFLAHRAAYLAHCGPIPDGLQVLHRCDVRPCVNPAHLFLGSQLDNMHDMRAKGRMNIARGERRSQSKLKEDDVRAIRLDQRSNCAIARDYGVSHTVIRLIRKGRIWTHVH